MESELLQQEIKNLNNKQNEDKTKVSQRQFQHTMNMIKSRLINNDSHNNEIDNNIDYQTDDVNIDSHSKRIFSDFEKRKEN